MNFKEAFDKYKAGIATPEEEAYVLEILEKGERLAAKFNFDEELNPSEEAAENPAEKPEEEASPAKQEDITPPPFAKEYATAPKSPAPGIASKAGAAISSVGHTLKKAGNKISGAVKNKIRPAGESEAARVRRKIRQKTLVTSLLVTLIVLLVTGGAVCAGIFGTATVAANGNTMSETAATDIAWAHINDMQLQDSETLYLAERSKELELELDLNDSFYEYEFKFRTEGDNPYEIKIKVNGVTGEVGLLKPYTPKK